jgi:hypothetical protein
MLRGPYSSRFDAFRDEISPVSGRILRVVAYASFAILIAW